jgi:hypothetical protein
VEGYRSLSSAPYAYTRFVKRISSTFQSNHQRGYFPRKTIISSGGRNSRPPIATRPAWSPSAADAPRAVSAVSTIAIGTSMTSLNAFVIRLSGRSG